MILVDTSVWIEHFRKGSRGLARLLEQGQVAVHPFIVGELACGHLPTRARILGLLRNLPRAPQASHEEVLYFIEQHRLMGRGIGWIDAHLLASVKLESCLGLWTRDRRLHAVAEELGLGGIY